MPPRLHPRNRNNAPYDFPALVAAVPELAPHLVAKPGGGTTLDFHNPVAVKRLNQALMRHHYGISAWDFPDSNLCPAVPGRADALHVIADLLARDNGGHIPHGPAIQGLDIGTGASLIYPLIGAVAYGWSFTATDIAVASLNAAEAILAANPAMAKRISLVRQPDPAKVFNGVVPSDGAFFDFTMCNPPFHSSAAEAEAGTRRKLRNLRGRDAGQRPTLNFAGVADELVCPGGELGFIRRMIAESAGWGRRVHWFTSLVSKAEHVKELERAIDAAGGRERVVLPMATGNKSTRVLAWTFLRDGERKVWREARWGKRATSRNATSKRSAGDGAARASGRR